MRRRKVWAACVVAAMMLCAPMQLAAEERAASTASHGAVLAWFAGLWSELAAWLADDVVPPAGAGATTQGSCAVDPFGCPGG